MNAFYCPQTKLQEGNIFTGVCLCTRGVLTIGGSGGHEGHAPLGVQILSISCSFQEILAKLYVGVPPGGLSPPPRGNPDSVTAHPR